jgi:hypothetical protein
MLGESTKSQAPKFKQIQMEKHKIQNGGLIRFEF